jgi:hypothetical protein
MYVVRSTIEYINCHFINHTAEHGGALMLFNSTLRIRMENNNNNDRCNNSICNNLNGSTTSAIGMVSSRLAGLIQNNIASSSGGFLFASRSSIHFDQYHVINNSAPLGGAVRLLLSSLILVGHNDPSIPSMIIQNNTARDAGGFMYAFNSTITIGRYYFKENRAGRSGGALYVVSTNLTIGENCSSNDPVMIENNMAINSSGGFLYGYDSTIVTYYSNFHKNQAPLGGAFSIQWTNLTIAGGWLFQNNSATYYGGCMYAKQSFVRLEQYTATNNNIMTSESLSPLQQCHVINNKASRGGSIYIVQTTFILLSNNLTEPNNVENNQATVAGGFLFGFEATILIYHSNFNKNQAEFGGAIYIDRSNLTLEGGTDSRFPIVVENNKAGGGGFFYGWNSSGFNATIGNFVFRNNRAVVR